MKIHLPSRLDVRKRLKDTFKKYSTDSYMDDKRNLKPINLRNKRVLIIGDLHAPFIHKDYLKHCIDVYKQWKCDTVVFIGDIIDNHYSSFHETDPNGLGGEDELEIALEYINEWKKHFPIAYITIGNHDRLIMRRAVSSNIPRQWIRTYKSVLDTPDWVFVEDLVIDGVLYTHGEGGTARTKIKTELRSLVQGHLHSQAYIEFIQGGNNNIFGMQVGCGVDEYSYGMAYAKKSKRPVISCGVVLYGSPYLELLNIDEPQLEKLL